MPADRDDDFRPKVIRPPNRAKDKVTLGGKIKSTGRDPKLLKRAEKNAAAMTDELVKAVDIDIDGLEATCREAETDTANRAQRLKDLQLLAHAVNEIGANAGYDLLSKFGYSLSTFLRLAEATDEARVNVARVHVDAIRLVYTQQITGDGGKIGKQLSKGLRNAVSKFLLEP